jgi:CheY-like chemotaxis protein
MNSKRRLIVEEVRYSPDLPHPLEGEALRDLHCNRSAFVSLGAHQHRPDLIVMDIGLMAGDVFRAMKQPHDAGHLANTPIIVISGGDVQTLKSWPRWDSEASYFRNLSSRPG